MGLLSRIFDSMSRLINKIQKRTAGFRPFFFVPFEMWNCSIIRVRRILKRRMHPFSYKFLVGWPYLSE